MKIEQLFKLVAEKVDDSELFESQIEAVSKATIEMLGFNVADDGTIVDPRPQPVINYPQQSGVRWKGSYKPSRRR